MSKQDLVHRATEPASAPIGHPAVSDASPEPTTPLPWEYMPSTEHHGPYIVSSVGGTIADLYTMSHPSEWSTANGGRSKPIPFYHEMANPNAELIVKAVNGRPALLARIATLVAALEDCLEYFTDKYDVVDGSYGEPSPNKEMQFGQMITEALYGPGVV